MKKIIQELILEFHKENLPVICKRQMNTLSIPKLLRKALVYVGMRRVGKTYLMYQHMQDQLETGINKVNMLYINFEDDRLLGFVAQDFQILLDVYFQLYPHLVKSDELFFYFDEIQNIEGWEKFIRRLLDKEKMSILITGSSAKSLSKEIATTLRGRSFSQEVFPFSFIEYLHYRGITDIHTITAKEKSIIKHHAQHYLTQGGFPETLETSEVIHHELIQSYVNTAVFRDVIDRYKISTPHIVKVFLIYCLQNIAAPLSITKVYKTLKSRGESLSRGNLYAYLDYFEDAYLIFNVPLFDLSARKRQVNPSKIYCADTGIIYAYSMKKEMERSDSLENAVYLELRRQQYENIYYYKTASGKEVDFVGQKINGSLSLFQVCLELRESRTKQREVDALIEALRELELDHGYIITDDENEILTKEDNVTIHILPYWQWVINASG